MRKILRLLGTICLCALLALSFWACNGDDTDGGTTDGGTTDGGTTDDGTSSANAEKLLSYKGLFFQEEGENGIRTLWSVDTEELAALEAEGYTVCYGALTGVASYDGQSLLSLSGLTLRGNAASGYTAPENAVLTCLYQTGATPSGEAQYLDSDRTVYAEGAYTNNAKTEFAYTTVFTEETRVKLEAEFLYRGFVTVSKGNSEKVYYTDTSGEIFGEENAWYGISTSMADCADYYVNFYGDDDAGIYPYNESEVLRRVLTKLGISIFNPNNLIALYSVDSPVVLAKPITTSYLQAARMAYTSPAYADYTTSIILDYETAATDFNDRPTSISLEFSDLGGGFVSYMLELSLSPDFSENVKCYELGSKTSLTLSHLYTGSKYYWRVTGTKEDGSTFTSPLSSFETAADAVRWINVDGARNVRDIGGWTGLNQGLVYRGSELNLVGSHGLQITEAGRKVLAEELGIKTDLDFRGASDNKGTKSPIGGNAVWNSQPIGGFFSAFSDSYCRVLSLFADPSNYPFYMHCWGGADRTGTVAMVLEGICGVAEEDMAIDLEMTSFSSFSYRFRYDNSTYLYASTLAKIKSDYEGETLQEKFVHYALDIGLTRAEISNIRSILAGTGVAFDPSCLEGAYFDTDKANDVTLRFVTPKNQTVRSLTIDGVSYSFTFEDSTLTLSGAALKTGGVTDGSVLTVTMSDGQALSTAFTSTSLLSSLEAGDYSLFFNDSAIIAEGGTYKKEVGGITFTHDALKALYDAGYTQVTFLVSVNMTGSVSDTDKRIRLLARWQGSSGYLDGDKQDISVDAPMLIEDKRITIHLMEGLLGSDNCFVLSPQSGEMLTISHISIL